MPFADRHGIRLHYETEGAGTPLVLQHGFSSRLETWRVLGWTRPLGARHQLVLIDARGHGRSDKPHDPDAYRISERVGDVVAVLDALRLPAAHFLGYSMGGLIGLALARRAPERLRSLVVGGAHPYPGARPAMGTADGRNPEAFIAAFEAALGERLAPETRRLLLANDLHALAAAARARPEPDAGVLEPSMPCLLFAGEADTRYAEAQRYAREHPAVEFVTVPAANHVGAMARSDVVVPRILEFLQRVDAAGGAV